MDSEDSTFDPFNTTPDPEIAQEALIHSLEMAQGFVLIFAVCNLPAERNRLIEIIKKRFPESTFEIVEVTEQTENLFHHLRDTLPTPSPNTVFVYGLENWLSGAINPRSVSFLANLNAARDSFPIICPKPIVFWVPQYVVNAIAEAAPDFFSVRSGIYSFPIAPEKREEMRLTLAETRQMEVMHYSEAERLGRIQELQGLLAEYRSLLDSERNWHSETNLLDSLAIQWYFAGHWQEAIFYYTESLEIYRTLGEKYKESQILTNLGNVYFSQGHWQEAIFCYEKSLVISRSIGDMYGEGQTLNNIGLAYRSQGRWQEAIACYEQDLVICRSLGDKHGEGATLNNLGIVYHSQGRWQEAITCYEQALLLFRSLGDKHGEGQALTNFGIVYHSQGRWQEAIACYEQALLLFRSLGDKHGEGQTLGNLGNVYKDQGRWQEAIACYEQDLVICRSLGDKHGEGQVLGNLGILYKNQERWSEAITCYEQALVIFRSLSDKNGEGQAFLNLSRVYLELLNLDKALEYANASIASLEQTEDTRLLTRVRHLVRQITQTNQSAS